MGELFKSLYEAITGFHKTYMLSFMLAYKRRIAWIIAWVAMTSAIIGVVLSVFPLLYISAPDGVRVAMGLIMPPNLLACVYAIAGVKLLLLIYRYKLTVASRVAH